jgi:tetratricopeptide (TPR) repeat protein
MRRISIVQTGQTRGGRAKLRCHRRLRRASALAMMVAVLVLAISREHRVTADEPVRIPSGAVATDQAPGRGRAKPAPRSESSETSLRVRGEEGDDTGVATDSPSEPAADDSEAPSTNRRDSRDPRVAPPPAEKPDDKPTKVEIEVAQFNGAAPGQTTRAELLGSWGAPHETTDIDGGVQQVYKIEPFEDVVATFAGDTLESILVNLMQPFKADELAKELELDDIRVVTVYDEQGEPLGQAFPERGVVFSFLPDDPEHKVFQVLVEPVGPQAFVLRAAASRQRRYRVSLADLDQALSLDQRAAAAHALRAELLSDLGRYPEALRAAEEAVAIDGQSAEYQLIFGRQLEQTGQFDKALAASKAAEKLAPDAPEWRAAALVQQADQLAAGPQRDFKQAVKLYQQAMELAEPLADDSRTAVRRRATDVLLRAHLGTARSIAWGNWKSKSGAVEKWLERSEVWAERMDKDELTFTGQASFMVAREALAALVGLQGKADPQQWTDEALENGRKLIDESADSLMRRRWEWELGMALYDTLQVLHMRRDFDPALEYGTMAVAYLERAGVERQQLPGHAYMMGRLYFRVGSIYAIQQQDHRKALPWFEKAVPLLEEPIPDSALADVGRQGETFVSMAVSYWQADDRKEALRLSNEGLKLVEQAVEQGILEAKALAVPYANLASMHRQMGDESKARKYSELANRVDKSTRR